MKCKMITSLFNIQEFSSPALRAPNRQPTKWKRSRCVNVCARWATVRRRTHRLTALQHILNQRSQHLKYDSFQLLPENILQVGAIPLWVHHNLVLLSIPVCMADLTAMNMCGIHKYYMNIISYFIVLSQTKQGLYCTVIGCCLEWANLESISVATPATQHIPKTNIL